jgi:hypothetical protein
VEENKTLILKRLEKLQGKVKNCSWEKYFPNKEDVSKPGKWALDIEKVKKEFNEAHLDNKGILRWNSNNSIPPDECLACFAAIGLISWKDAVKFDFISENETMEFLAKAYKSLPDEWDADEEELAEARANADNGDTFVNPIGAMLDLKSGKWKKM